MTSTEDMFDRTSWHDDTVYGFQLRVGDPERNDWTSDLVLDIDHIVEWTGDCDDVRFLVAPADLVFHGVTDLQVDMRPDTEGAQVAICLPMISGIDRERVVDQKIFLDRAYYRWTIRLSGYPSGSLTFGAVGFTQTLREGPVETRQQKLDRGPYASEPGK